MVTLIAFTAARCTEAGSMLSVAGPCSLPRPALKG